MKNVHGGLVLDKRKSKKRFDKRKFERKFQIPVDLVLDYVIFQDNFDYKRLPNPTHTIFAWKLSKSYTIPYIRTRQDKISIIKNV